MAEEFQRWKRPTIPAWISFLLVFAVLIGLGTWQMDRRAWKSELLGLVTARMAAKPLLLGARIGDPKALDYRRVQVTGRFLHGKEILISARPHRGTYGAHVVTPLVREGLPPVLVNRGWVSRDKKNSATRAASQVKGRVVITGLARTVPHKRLFTPDNDAAKGFWMTYDPAAMGQAVGIDAPLPVVVEADAVPNPGGFPLGGVTRVDFRNDHLQYAITWYSLALVLIVMFGLFHRRKLEAE